MEGFIGGSARSMPTDTTTASSEEAHVVGPLLRSVFTNVVEGEKTNSEHETIEGSATAS